ncbi:MAG: hypothetical protein AB8B55_19405 [Mariniblastus sp.]
MAILASKFAEVTGNDPEFLFFCPVVIGVFAQVGTLMGQLIEGTGLPLRKLSTDK